MKAQEKNNEELKERKTENERNGKVFNTKMNIIPKVSLVINK